MKPQREDVQNIRKCEPEKVFQIRPVQESELAEVAELEREIFSDAWSKKALIETYSQSHTVIAGAWQDERLLGYVILYYVMDEGEIARIAVRSSARRQGVAGRILSYIEEFCKERDGERLLLDVRESNVPAIAFYRKCGFKKDGIRKNFYTNPTEDAILMSRRIER